LITLIISAWTTKCLTEDLDVQFGIQYSGAICQNQACGGLAMGGTWLVPFTAVEASG
jgi:hypothetical protein